MTQTQGKVVLISGAMGGVGSAVASMLIEHGYRAALLYRSSSVEVAQKQKEFGDRALFIQCDVSNLQKTRDAVEEVLDSFGVIDMCVHTAIGKITRKPLAEMREDEFREAFEADVFGAFNLFSAAVPALKKSAEGKIIGITSSVIDISGTRMGAYTSSKFALHGLLRELYGELATQHIGVYAIAPGLLRTALTADLPDKYFEFTEAQAGEKLKTPVDVAQAVLDISKGQVESGTSLSLSTGKTIAL